MALMEYQILKMSSCLFILLFLTPGILCICPLQCTCTERHRHVDCSGRNLTTLPPGLQENIIHLNLSYNHFTDLHNQLTPYTNLRTLDISNNRLESLPAQLPRSLWNMSAANNNIKLLDKSDTAYQWNLKYLDVSKNMLEKVVLIKNTLRSLEVLNLSSNKLWTVPTNMPSKLHIVDLSNNSLTQILPGTLINLTNLTHLYLHNNKFTFIPEQSFDQLLQLQEITLHNNRWSCDHKQNITYLLKWVMETKAHVIGTPCSKQVSSLKEQSMYPTPPGFTSSLFTMSEMQTVDTINSLSMVTQPKVTKTPKQYRGKETTFGVTLSKDTTFSSTDRAVVAYPEDTPTEMTNSHEAAAATLTIHLQDGMSSNASLTSATKSPPSPVTLSIARGMPNNFSEMPRQSTTLNLRREETTANGNTRPPSAASAWKVNASLLLMLNAVVMLAG
ncbi:oligodendrocyte-myelin glycoprotein precursor [Mus musculus]|nr:oligodendrocyte-myelin glycoprotein precursor [Mus musculus]EDL15608.1 oligodendrocyte myelin glycoprotein [Mus musculus]|eukprot:NP_062282.2 oligodendrocyte-myelin glycoprotein precursor [Mus musculus]